MDDDFSIESIYEKGLGISVDGIFQNTELSVEDYDNSIEYEIAGMKSLIDSMELYMNMTELNKAQKIKMAHRINTNYGYYNRSLENYCEKLIRGTEDDGKDNEIKKEEEKKPNIFKRIFHKIKDFLQKIFDTIYRICLKIINKIRRLLKIKTKAEKDFEADIEKEQKNVMEAVESFTDSINNIKEDYDNMIENIGKLGDISNNANSDKKNLFQLLIKECKCISSYYTLLFKSVSILNNTVSQHYKLLLEKYHDSEDNGNYIFVWFRVNDNNIRNTAHVLTNAIRNVDTCIEDIIDEIRSIPKEKNLDRVQMFKKHISDNLKKSIKISSQAIGELVRKQHISFNFEIRDENDINQVINKLDEIIKILDDRKNNMDQFIFETFGLSKDKKKL